MSSTCASCEELLTPPILPCNCCSKLYHFNVTCAKLTVTEVRALELKTPTLLYFCQDCKNNGGLKQVFVDTLTNVINEFHKFTVAFGSVDNACETILKNKNDIMELSEKVKSISSSSSTTTANNELEIIQEIEERLVKKNNLILYKVNDTNNLQEDCSYLINIFASIGINISIKNVTRFGKYMENSGKPRPLLIKLSNSEDVDIVYKNKDKFKNIDIRKDKTKKQRNAFKNAAHELNERVKNGEKNLVIKLVNNIPAVLENLNNNDSMVNLNNQVQQASSNISITNVSSAVISSPNIKRKADDSTILDGENLQYSNENTKKLKNHVEPKN